MVKIRASRLHNRTTVDDLGLKIFRALNMRLQKDQMGGFELLIAEFTMSNSHAAKNGEMFRNAIMDHGANTPFHFCNLTARLQYDAAKL